MPKITYSLELCFPVLSKSLFVKKNTNRLPQGYGVQFTPGYFKFHPWIKPELQRAGYLGGIVWVIVMP